MVSRARDPIRVDRLQLWRGYVGGRLYPWGDAHRQADLPRRLHNKPAGADNDSTHKVASFKVLKASVKAYQRNINTHSSYKKFRKERAIQRDNFGKLNSLELFKYLDKYAETGIEYTKILSKIIKQNSLTDFDDVKILPTSKKLKNLI